MLSHVYFDFFGTLVDYDPAVHPAGVNAPHRAAHRAGTDVSPERASTLWEAAWTELDERAHRTGRECSMRDIAARFHELIGAPNTPDQALDTLVDECLAAWTANIRLARDVPACLAALTADGRRLSVVSNTHHPRLVQGLLERFGIADHFAEVFTSVEIGWRKPHPELFQAVLDRDGTTAASAVFVGDNWNADVEGPAGVGMRAFYVGVPAAGREPVTIAELPALIRAAERAPGSGVA